MADIKQELDKIKERISDANFLANKGLSNEVGIHVFTYAPQHELIVRDYIERLVNTPSDEFRCLKRRRVRTICWCNSRRQPRRKCSSPR